MAMRTRNISIQLTYDPVDGTKRLRFGAFSIDDSTNAAASYSPDGSIAGNRDLTSGELSGTLDAFLSAIKTEADGLHPS